VEEQQDLARLRQHHPRLADDVRVVRMPIVGHRVVDALDVPAGAVRSTDDLVNDDDPLARLTFGHVVGHDVADAVVRLLAG
jgi:hypothetical protein